MCVQLFFRYSMGAKVIQIHIMIKFEIIGRLVRREVVRV